MTLILSQVSWRWVLHVSDRLTTRAYGSTDIRPFEETSNKSVVFTCRDAIVSIAYTGAAFIGDKPTDLWIAETLHGTPIHRFEGRPSMMSVGTAPNGHLDLGRAISRLTDRLSDEATSAGSELKRAGFPTVELVGWRWKRNGRYRPVLVTLSFERNSYQATHNARHLGNSFCVQSLPDGHLSDPELAELAKALRSRGPLEAEEMLIRRLRAVADRNPYVGSDTMAILIPPPVHRTVYLRFDSPLERTSSFDLPSGARSAPTSFTPWIVSPRMVMAPTSATYGQQMGFLAGKFQFVIRSEANSMASGQPFGFLQSQQRLPKPSL